MRLGQDRSKLRVKGQGKVKVRVHVRTGEVKG